MSYNFVNVTINALGPDGSTNLPEGEIVLQVSDLVWDTSIASLIVVPAIVIGGGSGAYTGSGARVPLLAQDNPTLSTNWSWVLYGSLPNVRSVPTRKFNVNFANGANQNLTDLLATSTIVS